jgi:DNA repair exonuclease SbcCD ATPase subunit
MKIKSVEWKNFNSYGNIVQRIDFEEDRGDLYLLLGQNGHGKSTISEVITFALYGKIERKNKADLPNRINKNLWCKIVIRSKNKTVEIIRGVAPGLFEVIIDGAVYDTSGNANVQDYLDLEIFDIPYQVFKNIIVLSINDFRSFLTMSPGDKRNIVDRLFGFTIINQMKETIRSERKLIKEKLKTLSDELNIVEESILSINEKITNLEKDKAEDRIKLAKEYREKIIDLLESKKKIDTNIETLREKEGSIKNTVSKDRESQTALAYEIKSLNEKLRLYENSMCPTCGSSLEGEHHHNLRENMEIQKQIKEDQVSDIRNQIDTTQKTVDLLSGKLRELNDTTIKTGLRITQYKREIESLMKENAESDVTYLNQLIVENETKKREKKSKQDKSSVEDSFLEVVESVLGDDGVKNLAMKTILPSLNQSIHNMAKQIHLPYAIKFDDKFDCIVQSLGEEINPRSMSTGERKKADFIIIIALLKILKIRYPSLNILFLDEIFSSVDSAGIYEIIKILSDVSKENKINTWVINHTELPTELFDKRVEAIREGGFSKLQMETIS